MKKKKVILANKLYMRAFMAQQPSFFLFKIDLRDKKKMC